MGSCVSLRETLVCVSGFPHTRFLLADLSANKIIVIKFIKRLNEGEQQ